MVVDRYSCHESPIVKIRCHFSVASGSRTSVCEDFTAQLALMCHVFFSLNWLTGIGVEFMVMSRVVKIGIDFDC